MVVEPLRVQMFGKLYAQRGGEKIKNLDVRKVQELFCYLLLHPGQPQPREQLAGLLWGDCATAQSRAYLRKALWKLQGSLNHEGFLGEPRILLVEPEWVQLNSEARLWCDATILEQAFSRCQGKAGPDLDSGCVQDMQVAVELYQGDLLEGWYQDWCLYERERLQQFYLAMLNKLMDYCEARKEYEQGISYGTCVLRYDRAHEYTHRQLMWLYYLAGNRTAALRQYDRCTAALIEELGVQPDEETYALYERIKEHYVDPSAAASSFAAATYTGFPLREVLKRLQDFQSTLADMQRQIAQDIQVVENFISRR
jgi:DNA-binding SARP family transcriptional activator